MIKPKRFRKRPVVVEVVQLKLGGGPDIADWCGGIAGLDINAEYESVDTVYIDTKEGRMQANLNDYIIKGVAGEFYPCKPDIFKKTYEPAD